MTDLSDKELLEALGVTAETKKKASRTPKEARIIAGFEEIQKFVEENDRHPAHDGGNDIFERLYAVRLDRLREQTDCRELLAEFDTGRLLDNSSVPVTTSPDALDDNALLTELGVDTDVDGKKDITKLKHVKPRAEVRAAEEIANRKVCEDFETFKPLFVQVRQELVDGIRETRRFAKSADIKQGEFFIVNGQTAYVAVVGKAFVSNYERPDSRLRLIYDNGTESDILLRSLQRALYKDDAGRRITDAAAGPLFGVELDGDDSESGTIYVLRSKSDHPEIVTNREIIHKIGVTGGDVEKRVANAKTDATFLLADVEIIASYELFNINRSKLENLLHRFFAAARLDLKIEDRFGNTVRPREWFLVPLSVIDEVVVKLQDNSIVEFEYDPQTASLIHTSDVL